MIVIVNPSDSNGHSFKGLHAYCAHDQDRAQTSERVDWIDTRNIAANDPNQAWKIMTATAGAQNDLKRAAGIRAGKPPKDGAVTHVVLSFAEGEPTDRESIQAATDEFLSQFGVDPARMRAKNKPTVRQFADEHQVVMYAHTDTDNTHVHLMINRIHPETGRLLPDNNNFDKAQKWALEYSKRYGTDRLTPARQENRDMREDGEYVKGTRRKSRNIYELEQTLGNQANDNDRLQAVKDLQRRKDADLSLRGRNLSKLQAAAWDKLAEAHKQRKAALARDLQKKVNQAKADTREEYRPKWRELRKVQESEKATFAELEKSFFGRAANAAKLSADLVREERSGVIARTFRILSSAGARREYFELAQQRARTALQREQAAKVSDGAQALKRSQELKYAKNRAVFMGERESLVKTQALQRKKLQDDWRERSTERAAAFEAIQAQNPTSPKSKLDARAESLLNRSKWSKDFDKARNQPTRDQDNTRDDDHER